MMSLDNERRFICEAPVAHCREQIAAIDGVAKVMSCGENTLLVTLKPGRKWFEVRGKIRQILQEMTEEGEE